MPSARSLSRLGMVVGSTAIAITFANKAAAQNIFTDPNLFTRSTVIDFEPGGSGNTVSDINQFLSNSGTGATLSIGGAQARIDDLSDSDRAPLLGGSAPGSDGGPVSGVWGFEGGVRGESFLTLEFAPGYFVDAVGTFWGGVATRRARAVATFEDDSTFTAFVNGTLPLVSGSASDAEAINGFLGIKGDGKKIKEITFFNNNDFYSQDDVRSGYIEEPQAVPEPVSMLAIAATVGLGAIAKRKTA